MIEHCGERSGARERMANGVGGRAVLKGKRQQDGAILQQSVDRGAGLVRVDEQLSELAVAVSADTDYEFEAAVLDLGDIMPAAIWKTLARGHGALRVSFLTR
jgi:hypothetical protein